MTSADEIHLWLWEYTDQFGKRVVSRWLMAEDQAKQYKDAVKVEGSLKIQKRLSTDDFPRSPPKS